MGLLWVCFLLGGFALCVCVFCLVGLMVEVFFFLAVVYGGGWMWGGCRCGCGGCGVDVEVSFFFFFFFVSCGMHGWRFVVVVVWVVGM